MMLTESERSKLEYFMGELSRLTEEARKLNSHYDNLLKSIGRILCKAVKDMMLGVVINDVEISHDDVKIPVKISYCSFGDLTKERMDMVESEIYNAMPELKPGISNVLMFSWSRDMFVTVNALSLKGEKQ